MTEIARVEGISEDNFSIFYEIEIEDGERMDTNVFIQTQNSYTRLITIAGCDADKFNSELKQLFEKYRI